jgi:hypothetical protein
MASFEAAFRIPSAHVLKIKFHSYGGNRPEVWSHVEYDDNGQFVARYETRILRNEAGKPISDVWKKFDINSVLVASDSGVAV